MQREVGQRNIHLKCMPYRDGIVIGIGASYHVSTRRVG